MENKHNHHCNHGNSFLIGVIVGVIVTLLVTTKKGREIVKDLAEKGLDKFAELQNSLNEVEDRLEDELEEEMLEGEDYVEGVSEVSSVSNAEDEVKSQPIKVSDEKKGKAEAKAEPKEHKNSNSRRFFLKRPQKKS